MASTADRLKQLISENLEVDGKPVGDLGDLNVSLSSLGVSSVDIVAFGRLVVKEFNLPLTPEDCVQIETLQALVDRIDG